ncbi:MAG: hypothetical protein COA43_15835 [Robiginitomaculum sp.]|nr:MAG: hypothetical protein COA43_15835 [Robiginitomaculum sp.]
MILSCIIRMVDSAVLCCFVVLSFANASTVIDRTSLSAQTIPLVSTKNDSVQLQCVHDENRIKISRAFVLQVSTPNGHNKYEYALTTGHGFSDIGVGNTHTCKIVSAGGAVHDILSIRFAKNYKVGTPSDWAILVFKTKRKKNYIRYLLPQSEDLLRFDDMAEVFMPVKFSEARGISHNTQSCTLVPRRKANMGFPIHSGFIPHTCRAVSGQSGSPVTVQSSGVAIALGINIGNVFSFGEFGKKERPRFYGYMRVIDTEMVRELNGHITNIESELHFKK